MLISGVKIITEIGANKLNVLLNVETKGIEAKNATRET